MNAFFQWITWLKAGWAIGTLIGLGIQPLAYSDDIVRYRLEPLAVVMRTARLEPIPQPEPDAPQNDPEQRPPADNRPVLYVYTMAGCRPCEQLKAEVEAGAFEQFRVEWRAREQDQWPEWVEFAPRIQFQGNDGQWYVYPRREASGALPTFGRAQGFLAVWQQYHPEQVFNVAAGKSLVDQLALFAGVSGTITVTPDRPVQATLDDLTVLSYSRLTGKYRIANGRPLFTFETPLPRVDARKFGLHFGAQIQQAAYEPPATLAIDTTRGKYRLRLEEVLP